MVGCLTGHCRGDQYRLVYKAHRTFARYRSVRCKSFGWKPRGLQDAPKLGDWAYQYTTKKSALDFSQYWVNRASSAARNEREKGIALHYKDEDALTVRSEGLLEVLGVGPQALLEMVSREPGILLMSDNELALRLLALKAAVPRINIQELVRRRPQVLRNKHGVRAVERAVRDLEALMPALPVQDRILNKDGTMWQSFSERMLYWESQSQNDESLNL